MLEKKVSTYKRKYGHGYRINLNKEDNLKAEQIVYILTNKEYSTLNNLKEENIKLKKLEKEIQTQSTEHDKTENTHQQQVEQLKQTINQLKEDNRKQTDKISEQQAKIEELENTIHDQSQTIVTEMQGNQDKIKNLENQLKQLQAEKKHLQQEKKDLNDTHIIAKKKYKESVASYTAELDSLKQELQDSKQLNEKQIREFEHETQSTHTKYLQVIAQYKQILEAYETQAKTFNKLNWFSKLFSNIKLDVADTSKYKLNMGDFGETQTYELKPSED